MTIVVPYDGSPLAGAALLRAAGFAEVTSSPVVAVTVVKGGNAAYARERGWLGEDEPYDHETVVERLRGDVASLVPDAEFRHEVVDKRAPSGTVSRRLRRVADELDARLVAVGSDNAGHVAVSLSSVGDSIVTDDAYDVLIVRRADEERLAAVRAAPAADKRRDGFYRFG